MQFVSYVSLGASLGTDLSQDNFGPQNPQPISEQEKTAKIDVWRFLKQSFWYSAGNSCVQDWSADVFENGPDHRNSGSNL